MTDVAKHEAEADALEDYVHMLRGFGRAYPTSIFHEPTKEERAWLAEQRPGLQDCIAASMGRHMAKFTDAAADKIESLAADLESLRAEVEGLRERVCEWVYDDDPDASAWDTACGNRHVFVDGGPQENEHHFCPYCAGKLIEHAGAEPPKDEA